MGHRDPLVVYVAWRSKETRPGLHPVAERLQGRLSSFRRPSPNGASGRLDPPGVPVLFRTATGDGMPEPIAVDSAERVVLVLLVDSEMFQARRTWGHWVDDAIDHLGIQGVAGDRNALIPLSDTTAAEKLCGSLQALNVIKTDWSKDEAILQLVVVRCLQLLQRSADSTVPSDTVQPVSVFLSHTKRGIAVGATGEDSRGGETIAEALRDYLLKKTQAKVFFDRHDIPPGLAVDSAIRSAIDRSSMLVVLTDQFAESGWCLDEVRLARQAARPIVVADAVAEEMAIPPATLGRAPRFRYGGPASIERIVSALLLETLRERYFRALVLARGLREVRPLLAPDDFDLGGSTTLRNIVYPDPPLPRQELARLEQLGCMPRIRTILEYLASEHFYRTQSPGSTLPERPLGGATIGLSISAVDEIVALPKNRGVTSSGLGQRHIDDLFCEIARLLVILGARIAIGTDLRNGGFTDQVLDVLDRYAHGTARQDLLVCYLSPLVGEAERDMRDMEALRERADVVEVPWPADTPSRTASAALTAMRVVMNGDCRARIVFGGKLAGYAGAYPGALEEVALSVSTKQPLYLLGGLGGVARAVYDVIACRSVPELLTSAGQRRANPDNREVASDVVNWFYANLVAELSALGPEGLATRNGLDIDDNQRLAVTTSVSEIAGLVARGLARLGLSGSPR